MSNHGTQWTVSTLLAHLSQLEDQDGSLKDYEFTVQQPRFLNDNRPTVEFRAKIVMPKDWVGTLEMSG